MVAYKSLMAGFFCYFGFAAGRGRNKAKHSSVIWSFKWGISQTAASGTFVKNVVRSE